MVIDMNYWSKVFKKLLVFVLSILGIYLAFKFAVFYMPFLIAFVLSLILEPVIRFFMRRLNLKRKTSAIIVFVVSLSIIIGLLIWGIVSLTTESYNLLNGLNEYFEVISNRFQTLISQIDLSKLHLSGEIMNIIQNSAIDILNGVTNWAKGVLTNLLEVITSIPTIIIYVVITILSLYFICTDKIYMLDQLEHHFPKTWVKRISKFVKEVSSSLGALLKAQVILILISFFICLIGLYIFKIAGLNVGFPLLAALGIGFVDALPIFGSAAVMIPWAIIAGFNGDLTLGISLIVLLIVMSMVRQFMEPRIVSGQIGIHPIFTLIAMYTGFRIIGVLGLLFGPVILIILKNIFSAMIDKGVAKAIFERE